MSDDESDRSCCKGCPKQPCDKCYKYLCPTSGHGEGYVRYDSWLCYECMQKLDYYVLKLQNDIYSEAHRDKRILSDTEDSMLRKTYNLSVKEISNLQHNYVTLKDLINK